MIGLTGGIASGKSTVTARLKALGAFVADADEVSREVISFPAVLEKIREAFGGGVFAPDGNLDRVELASRVFSSEKRAAALNGITHPVIREELLRVTGEAEASGLYPLVFVDAALLIESGFNELCERVWLVTAGTDTRIRRIMERDGATYEQACARISSQMPEDEKRAYADVVIENDSGLKELIEAVDAAFFAELKLGPVIDEIRNDYEEN